MSLINMQDEDIINIALPMINVVIKASNDKNWEVFSQYQTHEEATDPENRKNVERQWEEYEALTSFSLDKDLLGVLRRGDMVQVLWKLKSTKVAGDFLASYALKEFDGEVREIGFQIM